MVLLLAAGVGKVPALANTTVADPRAVFDSDIPPLLADYSIPSLSFAEISHGRIARVLAYGSQRPGVPATALTLYNIASLTKPITAEVILRVMSADKMSLDEPMYPYWTDPDIADDPRRTALTPRLALSHQTGFPNWRDEKRGLTFTRDPATQWGYSGEGYQYVARFTEKRTGKDFETLAQRYLFDPAGMAATSYTGKPTFDERIAMPTNAAGATLPPTIATHFNAADLVYSTPRDYAKFMVDVLGDRGLGAEIANERNRSQVSMKDMLCQGAKARSCPIDAGFGLGWQILAFKGETLMMHTGKDEGVFTFAYLNRSTKDGVVIFTNSDDGYKIILPVLERLATSPAFLAFLRGQMD